MVTLEPMEDGERGLIVNTASVAAQDGQIGQAAYSASKGGVYAMTLPVARDLAQEGIRCNTILPGIMWTPMMAGMDQKIQDALAAADPLPQPSGQAFGLCVAGAGAGPQRLHQRRMHPAGRGHPAGAALTRGGALSLGSRSLAA